METPEIKLNKDGTIPYEMVPLPKKNIQTQFRKLLVRIDKIEKHIGINNLSKSVKIEPKEEIKKEESKAKKKSKK